jgi:hypothetical protein
MSPTATMTRETGTTERERAAARFGEALWGIRSGRTSPKMWTTTAAYAVEDGVGEWLYRLWGIGGASY